MKIHKIFQDTIVIFLAGVIFSALVELAIEIPAQRYFSVFLAIFALFILYASVTLRVIYKKIDAKVNQFGLSTTVLYDPLEGSATYKQAKEVVTYAQDSILIISHYSPSKSRLEFPEMRKSYLSDGLEKLLQLKFTQARNTPFSYKRIIQTVEVGNANGVLTRSMLTGDPETYEHCVRVYNMVKNAPKANVNIGFRISEPIHSFPSMLIVDNKYVLLGLTTKPPQLAKSDEGFLLAGALFIEDPSGETVQGFKSIFERFYQNSEPIVINNTGQENVTQS